MTTDDIRKRTQERLASGRLQRAYHVIAKPPTGGERPRHALMAAVALDDPCAVCDGPETQIRYNVAGSSYPVAFHKDCHDMWKEEAAKLVRRFDRLPAR